jgi:hypothetical protein
MSVKSDNEDEVPDPAAVEGIMKILGFAGSWDQCQVKIETLLDGGKAVEVGQLIQ